MTLAELLGGRSRATLVKSLRPRAYPRRSFGPTIRAASRAAPRAASAQYLSDRDRYATSSTWKSHEISVLSANIVPRN